MKIKYLCYLSSLWVSGCAGSIFGIGWEAWVICVPVCVMSGILFSHIEKIEGEK